MYKGRTGRILVRPTPSQILRDEHEAKVQVYNGTFGARQVFTFLDSVRIQHSLPKFLLHGLVGVGLDTATGAGFEREEKIHGWQTIRVITGTLHAGLHEIKIRIRFLKNFVDMLGCRTTF